MIKLGALVNYYHLTFVLLSFHHRPWNAVESSQSKRRNWQWPVSTNYETRTSDWKLKSIPWIKSWNSWKSSSWHKRPPNQTKSMWQSWRSYWPMMTPKMRMKNKRPPVHQLKKVFWEWIWWMNDCVTGWMEEWME